MLKVMHQLNYYRARFTNYFAVQDLQMIILQITTN